MEQLTYLTLPKQALVFTCLQYKSFKNTVGKGEISHNEQFLLFPQCFLVVLRIFCHFLSTENWCLQTCTVWKSLDFFWKGSRLYHTILPLNDPEKEAI